MGIEQHALRVGAQQRLVGVLAVDVDEELADFAQLLGGRRRTVDVAARAAAGIEDAPQDQFFIPVEIVGRQPFADRRQPGDVEGRRHLGPFAAGAHDTGVGALAERQRQRIDQDRLARPGFPGQRAETTGKLQFEAVDDDEVADCQPAQHHVPFGRSLQCSFWRSMAK